MLPNIKMVRLMILAESTLLPLLLLLLLLSYLIISSMMDVNLIGSKQISSDLVKWELVVPTQLLNVSQKVKLNAKIKEMVMILSILNLMLIGPPTVATARNPMEILSIQTIIKNHPPGELAESVEEQQQQQQQQLQMHLLLTQMDASVNGSRQMPMEPVK